MSYDPELYTPADGFPKPEFTTATPELGAALFQAILNQWQMSDIGHGHPGYDATIQMAGIRIGVALAQLFPWDAEIFSSSLDQLWPQSPEIVMAAAENLRDQICMLTIGEI